MKLLLLRATLFRHRIITSTLTASDASSGDCSFLTAKIEWNPTQRNGYDLILTVAPRKSRAMPSKHSAIPMSFRTTMLEAMDSNTAFRSGPGASQFLIAHNLLIQIAMNIYEARGFDAGGIVSGEVTLSGESRSHPLGWPNIRLFGRLR